MSLLFGTDGIRGPVFTPPLVPDDLWKIGLAIGTALKGAFGSALLGMDTRNSGPFIKQALSTGLLCAGVKLIDVGVLSTPALAYLGSQKDVDFSLMISASHNLFYDNGIKLFGHGGKKLSTPQEQLIEQTFLNLPPLTCLENLTNITQDPHALGSYKSYLLSIFSDLDLSGLKLAIDCAHGALSDYAASLFEAFGAEVFCTAHHPDGTNINDKVGAMHPEALQTLVKNTQADLGFTFDGDGDRVLTVLEDGTLLEGDQMLCLLALAWQEEGRLAPSRVVSTLMANHRLKTTLQAHGISLKQTQVGDKHVAQALEETEALLGGESSGHMILKPFMETGDGLMVALELLRIHRQRRPLKKAFTPCPQILKNVRVHHKKILESEPWLRFFSETIAPYGEQLFALIRPSGTEPLIRIMLQGEDGFLLQELAEVLAQKLHQLDASSPLLQKTAQK